MAQPTTQMPRRKGPPTALCLQGPPKSLQIVESTSSASTSTTSSPSSELDAIPFCPPPQKKGLRNMKRLSLALSTDTSPIKFPIAQATSAHSSTDDLVTGTRPRRSSVVSLPSTSINTMLHRKEEDGSPTVPYIDGPIQIIPGVWLGSEDNARDWKGLMERGIKTILNVAKEVVSPFDSAATQPLRPFVSTPDLYKKALEHRRESDSTFYPSHLASGRPGMHYLKLDWSHGEADLVSKGFPLAMAFVDAALQREEGVLIHCQCGISRSATLIIALVMRAAALRSTSVPPEVWALKGYQQSYSFVKNKSKWVGPNMSLIYQLLEYERALKSGDGSPTPSEGSSTTADEEEEWGRRRQMMDEISSDSEEPDNSEVAREARALDKAMEDRIIARKSSASSVASSGMGMGQAWRSRYDRKRAGSIGSNFTSTASILSEDLVEEDEEEALLGVGGGFDSASSRGRVSSGDLETCSTSSESPVDGLPSTLRATPATPLTARPEALSRRPPSAPAFRKSFNLPPAPKTSTRSTFNIPSRPPSLDTKTKRRPPPLGLKLSPVPSSPVPVAPEDPSPCDTRKESRRLSSHSVHLRNSLKIPFPTKQQSQSVASTPSQTLFVFPPDRTPTARTPSTMTLFNPGPSSALSTPRVSTFRSHGRLKSFIGLGVPPTPTTACSRVDAKGWFGSGQ